MNQYKPGQSVRLFLVSSVFGELADPANSVVTMFCPDGSVTPGTPAQDSLGRWHADFVIPLSMVPGQGVFRWVSSGVTIVQNGIGEDPFTVLALDF
jgi:hypothetical protein